MRLVSTFTDEELEAELRGRGYIVVRRDQVQDLEVGRTHHMHGLNPTAAASVREHIAQDIGAFLGVELIARKLASIAEAVHEAHYLPPRSEFTARVVVIRPGVDVLGTTTMPYRPLNCRNRLRDEGKAYPKSGCDSCGDGGLRGCPHTRDEAGQRIRSPQSTMSPR